MSYTKGNPGNLSTASEIIYSAFENIASEPLLVKYGDILFPEFFPQESINTTISPGDDLYSKRIKDRRGVASFRAVQSNDVNLVGVAQDKITVPMLNAAIGAVLDLQDIARAEAAVQRGLGESATAEATEAMKIGSDRHIEKLWFFGDTVLDGSAEVFYPGLMSSQFIPQSTVATGGGGGTEWINGANSKTADEIIFDLSIAIGTTYKESLGLFIPNEIYLPLDQFNYLTSLKAGTRANDEVVWRFISEQNVLAAIDGKNITFRPLRYLSGAGVGGTDRMMIATREKDNYMMGMSIPFQLLATDQFGFLQYFFGEHKLSPVRFPYPTAFAYWDGI